MKVGSCKIIVIVSIQFWKWEFLEGSILLLSLIYCSDRTDLLKTVIWRIPLDQIWHLRHSSNWTGVKLDWRQLIFVFLNQIFLWLFSKVLFGVAKSSRLDVGFLKSWFFCIQFQCIVEIFQSFFEFANPVETGSSGEQSVHMLRVQLNDQRKIFNGHFDLLNFLVCTAHQIISSDIFAVDLKYSVTVVDGLIVLLFLHVWRCSDVQGLLMLGIRLELKCADFDQMINVDLMTVNFVTWRLRRLHLRLSLFQYHWNLIHVSLVFACLAVWAWIWTQTGILVLVLERVLSLVWKRGERVVLKRERIKSFHFKKEKLLVSLEGLNLYFRNKNVKIIFCDLNFISYNYLNAIQKKQINQNNAK